MLANLSDASVVALAKGNNLSVGVEGWNPYITSNGECWAASLIEQL
jgi:hypothetical protein